MADRSIQCKYGVSDGAQVLPLKKIVRLENVGFVNSVLQHRSLKTISKFKFALLCHHLQHDNVFHQLEAGTGCVYLIYRSRAEGIHQPAQFLVRKRLIIFDLYMSLWSSQDVTYVTFVALVLQKLNLQRMTPFCKASAYPWFCGHSPTTTWVNLDSDSGAKK